MTKNERIEKLMKEVAELQLAVSLIASRVKVLERPGIVYGPPDLYGPVPPQIGTPPWEVTCHDAAQ